MHHPAQRQETLVRRLKFPARILFKEGRDFLGENFPKLGQLLFTHAVDEAEVGGRGGIIMGHVAQGDIAENDVARDAAFVGQRSPELAQLLEQRLVAFDFAGL